MGLASTPCRSTEISSSPDAQDQSGTSADTPAIQQEVQQLFSATTVVVDDESIVNQAHATSCDNAMPSAHTEKSTSQHAHDIGGATRSEQIANTELAPSQSLPARAATGLANHAHSEVEEQLSACASQKIESINGNDSKPAQEEDAAVQSTPAD